MGNWRTVTIVGTCPEDEVDALYAACDYGAFGSRFSDRDYEKFHCLSMSNGLFGLGAWVKEHIDSSGNLAERDYTPEDVRDQLEKLAKVAPGLRVKVHCGGDWEDPVCITTVTLDENGARMGEPEIERIRGASETEALGRMFQQLGR